MNLTNNKDPKGKGCLHLYLPPLDLPTDESLIIPWTRDEEDLHLRSIIEKSMREVQGLGQEVIDGEDQLGRVSSMVDDIDKLAKEQRKTREDHCFTLYIFKIIIQSH